MARRTIDVPLGEYVFKMTSLPGEEALTVWHRCVKHALPPIVGAIESLNLKSGSLLASNVDFAKLSGAVGDLMASLDEAELQKLKNGLLKGTIATTLDGHMLGDVLRKDIFDLVFCENVQMIFELMWASINLNYSRFLDGFRTRLAAIQPSPNQSTSGPM